MYTFWVCPLGAEIPAMVESRDLDLIRRLWDTLNAAGFILSARP
jgi:hypothetical protein